MTLLRFIRKNHILNSKQFNRENIDSFVKNSQDIIKYKDKYKQFMHNKILANMFFEPSTRTSSSFQSAMMRLGGNVIQFNPETSSTKKKESLLDTIRVIEQYTDITVIRHPESNILDDLIPHVNNPIINAGDGQNEHPTQGLLDILTMHQELKRENLDGLNITMVGDLKYGRTVHSLATLLSNYNDITFNFVSSEYLQMPKKIINLLDKTSSNYNINDTYDKYMPKTDVLYMTRVQEERFSNKKEYDKVSDLYKLTLKDMNKANENMIILHPLPRVNEIAEEIDNHPSAKYFAQAKYGMYMRMCLLCYALGYKYKY